MSRRIQRSEVRLEGPIEVAWRRKHNEWHCRVLQFDIVGTGETKEQAFEEMRSLFVEYILWAAKELMKGNRISFHNPSEAEEWDKASTLKNFNVQFTIKALKSPKRESYARMKSLIRFINSLDGKFESADLVAV